MNKQKEESEVNQNFLNIPKPGDDFDRLDELTKGNYYKKVYNTLIEFKKEIQIAFDSLDNMSRDYNDKMERMRTEHKRQIEAFNQKMDIMAKRAEYQNLYIGANRRVKDLESELNAQVTFLEKELADRNEKIKLLSEKIAEMTKNEFMVNEQLASLRRDFENASKKVLDYENRQKRKLQQKEDGQLSDSRDNVGTVKKASPVVPRPGSRGNPLAPIKSTALVPANKLE